MNLVRIPIKSYGEDLKIYVCMYYVNNLTEKTKSIAQEYIKYKYISYM